VAKWQAEATLRGFAGFIGAGGMVTMGMRIDEKRTMGLALAMFSTYYDAYPAYVDKISPNLYYRRYFHFGPKRICSIYIDGLMGVSICTGVRGQNSKGQTPAELGRVWFNLQIDPGVKLRIFKNIHLFIGPSIGSTCIGLHAGLGV